jgi:hypothetical protein
MATPTYPEHLASLLPAQIEAARDTIRRQGHVAAVYEVVGRQKTIPGGWITSTHADVASARRRADALATTKYDRHRGLSGRRYADGLDYVVLLP